MKYRDRRHWKKNLVMGISESILMKKKFNIFKVINETHRRIKKSTKDLTEKSTKKSLIDELSSKLLRLEFKK